MTKTWSARPRTKRLSVTLCFHGVGEAPGDCPSVERPYWVSEARFTALLERLDELEAHHGVEIHLDFDDGHQSDHACVLPLLERVSRRAAFFVPTDWIGTSGHLTTGQIKELALAGMTVGSHGTDHRAWTGLSENELSRQLRHSKRVLEQATGMPVRLASAPFGLWSPRVATAVREAGYERLHTCGERPGRNAGFLNHRIVVRSGDDVGAILSKKLNVLRRAIHRAKDLHDSLLLQAA